MIIDNDTERNLISCGSAFEYEDNWNPLIYNEEDIKSYWLSEPYRMNVPEKVIKVQWGILYSLILSVTGKVYSFGCNSYGQLGLDHSKYHRSNSMEEIKGSRIPLLIEDLVFEDDFVVDIAAGYTHCLALTLKRRVFTMDLKS